MVGLNVGEHILLQLCVISNLHKFYKDIDQLLGKAVYKNQPTTDPSGTPVICFQVEANLPNTTP